MAQFIRIATRKARSLLHIIIGIPVPVEVQLIKAEISSGAGQAFDSRRMACNYDRSQVPLNYSSDLWLLPLSWLVSDEKPCPLKYKHPYTISY